MLIMPLLEILSMPRLMTLDASSSADDVESDDVGVSQKSAWRVLFTESAGLKPLVIINIVFVLQQLVGAHAVFIYALPILKESGSTMDTHLTLVLIGVVRLLGCLCASLSMGRAGRRTLLVASSSGQAAAIVVFAGFLAPSMAGINGSFASPMPLVAGVLVYMAFGCLGWQVVPWAMAAEHFPHEARNLAQTINMCTSHLYMFAMLQLYPTLYRLLGGVSGIQYLFCGASVLSAGFVWMWLPETRRRTLAEIEEYYASNVTIPSEKRRRRDAWLTH